MRYYIRVRYRYKTSKLLFRIIEMGVIRVFILCAILTVISRETSAEYYSVEDSVLTVNGGVHAISAKAFADRDDFVRVEFAEPCVLTEIGEYAFIGCSNLRTMALPASLQRIGEGAFRECASLKSMVIPEGVTALPRYAFAWCQSLSSVSLPRNLADIGSHAFAYCSTLNDVDVPGGVKHIGSNVFSFCSSLAEIELPASVTELESYAFSECVSLRRVTLPGNGNLLGELIFSGCRSLEEISISSPVPPKFDCNSTLFEDTEPDMYLECRLLVPYKSVELYRRSPGWGLFKYITPAK